MQVLHISYENQSTLVLELRLLKKATEMAKGTLPPKKGLSQKQTSHSLPIIR